MRVSKKSSIATVFAIVAMLATAMSSVAQQAASQDVKPETADLSTKPIPKVHIDNFGCINPNYYRGARPKTNDYKDLAAMGIKSVINLEGSGDKNAERDAEAAGLKFFHIPMSDKSAPSDAAVQQFLQIANDPTNQPIFVHCKGGRHRTGLVTAVYRMEHDNWTVDQAYDEMKKFDFSYGFGHGDLKTYVFNYHPRATQNNAVGVAATTANSN